MKGVKASQYDNYMNKIANKTAPQWMQDIGEKWQNAHNLNLWPSARCNDFICYRKVYFLGGGIVYDANINVGAISVNSDYFVELGWQGYSGSWSTGKEIDIMERILSINKIFHWVTGIQDCNFASGIIMSGYYFFINYRIKY